MAPDHQEVLQSDPTELEGESFSSPSDWYDRSSLSGDFLVMIADQTEDEYLRRAPEYPFCECIDGIVYLHAAVSWQHQFDVQLLIALLEVFNSERGVGLTFSGPAMVRLRDGVYLEPDVLVLPPDTNVSEANLNTHPPALLVVEVLLPSTRKHDLEVKAALYREANAAEVWFIDGRDKVVIVDRRTADGRESFKLASGPLQASSLAGFWFDIDWLWADTRPNLLHCLDQILEGPPP